jgi:hypothetical protein
MVPHLLKDAFGRLCRIKATIPESCLKRHVTTQGRAYWDCEFDVVVTFGTTEFQCHVEWLENVSSFFFPSILQY